MKILYKHRSFFKVLSLFFIFLFIFHSLQAQKTEIFISGNYDNIPLSDFLSQIEKDYQVKFYFEESRISEITITGNYSEVPLTEILRENFKHSSLDFIVINSRTIGIYRKTAHAMEINLPGYEKIGLPSEMNGSKTARIEGKVIDGSTGEPIVGANIHIQDLKTGTISDINGHYILSVSPGKYEIEFSSVEYMKNIKKVVVYSSGKLNVELYGQVHAIEQVEIKASKSTNDLQTAQMSVNRISREKIRQMPTFLGEADVVKSILMLPGVSSSGEASSGINIRGGNADQNLFIMDEVPLFSFTHLFGFFSAINPDIVENVTVYKGAIPPSYGGRLASVVDIDLQNEIPERLVVNGNAGIIASRISVKTPLLKERASLLLSGRASYSDWVLEKSRAEALSESSAGFHDANLRFTAKTGKKGHLAINSYTSRDRFNFENVAGQKYGTDYVQVRYSTLHNSRLSSVFTAFYSEYETELTETADSLSASRFSSGIDQSGINYKFSYFPAGNHELTVGMNNLFYVFHQGERERNHPGSVIAEGSLPLERAFESALFLQHEIKAERFSVTYGLRFSAFMNLGGANLFVYENIPAALTREITDTLHYDPLEINSTHANIEPRISAQYRLNENSSLKISYARTSQYIHLLSNTTSITPSDIWKPSGRIIEPQKGDQVAAGIINAIPGTSLQLSLESYYKRINGIMDLRGGKELLMNPFLEAELLEAKGRAYGIEFMLKKEGKLNGWFSYTYSRSERKTLVADRMYAINGGEYYPADYDKPHDLKLVLNYQANARTSLSLNYIYTSGRPVTYPEGYYTMSNIPVIHYSEKNAYRIPDYKRLDISLNYDFYSKKSTKYKSGISISVYNLLSNDNTYSVFFRNEQNVDLRAYRVLLVDKPVPAVSYYFRF